MEQAALRVIRTLFSLKHYFAARGGVLRLRNFDLSMKSRVLFELRVMVALTGCTELFNNCFRARCIHALLR